MGAEQVAEPRGGGAERHEHDGEPGDEQADAPQQRPDRAAGAGRRCSASSSAADSPDTIET